MPLTGYKIEIQVEISRIGRTFQKVLVYRSFVSIGLLHESHLPPIKAEAQGMRIKPAHLTVTLTVGVVTLS